MKYLLIIWLSLCCFIIVDCKKESTDSNTNVLSATKKVEVFDLHVYASGTVPDNKILHAAGVLAEYLDSDEDGSPDNQLLYEALKSQNAAIVMN